MRHSLGTIAWRGLKGRRRDTAMMLCVLAAVFALLTAVLCYQQSGSRAMEVQRQDLYGAWQLARYDLTAADADAFVQQTAPAAVGRAAQYAILVNDKDLAFGALGTVDEGYLSCGQLQLLSGRLPGTAGEAALTTSVLDSIGASYELGQTVTLQAVHGDDAPVLLQFTLCGCCPPTMPTGRWAATCRWMRWSPPTVCPKAGTAKYSCCAAMLVPCRWLLI